MRQPGFRISERAETQLGAGTKIGNRFADQFEFGVECGNVLARLERLHGEMPGRAGGIARDDIFQAVKFQDLLRGAGHFGPQ